MLQGTQNQKSNADLMNDNEMFGISHLTKLTIVVEGKQIKSYKHFELSQSATGHHEFSLTLDYDSLGEPEDHHLENAQKYLGQRILVTFKYKNVPNGPERHFIGVVTKIGLSREHRNMGDLIFSGYSPTILLDKALHVQSFGGDMAVSLNYVANTVLRQALDEQNYPIFTNSDFGNVSFSCQYNETHYNYLARLAETHGQQFFYDGYTVKFGKLTNPEKAIELYYGKNVDQIEISIKTLHVNPRYFGYNSSDDDPLKTNESDIKHVSSLGKVAYQISQKTFKAPSYQAAPIKARTSVDVQQSQNSTAGSAAVETFVTTGRTSVPFLFPGCVVDMQLLKPGTKQKTYFTRLMITKIEHTVDKLGTYVGRFEAVGNDTGYLPRPEFTEVKAEAQFGTVVSNEDKMGRVKVHFPWQRGSENTDWVRVLTPDAGSSKLVNKNRGFVFIPEVGDQVMVGFIHGHPDRPYVMGGLFHGKIGLGGQQENHLKTIITRSGCTIQIDDTENKGSITIHDPSGNKWYMDGAGNIDVTAPNTMTLNSKNMNINVIENMTSTIGNNISTSAGQNINITAGNDIMESATGNRTEVANNRTEMVTETVLRQSNNSETFSGEIQVNTTEGNMTMQGAKEIEWNSGEKSNLF